MTAFGTNESRALQDSAAIEVKVLSLSGNRDFGLPAEQQEFMCLTSDGILYVSEAHRSSHHVMEYRERLIRRKFAHKVRLARHSDVAALYKELKSSNTSVDDPSIRQSEVIRIMRDAVKRGASDIHFRMESDSTRIKIRVDGELEDYPDIGLQHGMALVSAIYQSMCDIAQPVYLPNKPQDARLSSEHTAAIGLKGARLATRPTDIGQVAVLRLLYRHKIKATLANLGFLPEQIADTKRMTSRTSGINIVSGPTGSGKSTTLEALLSQLLVDLDFKRNLITLEDPPEYEIPGAVQTPIQYDSDATDDQISTAWARAISNLMRLDPDLAMIGEMRDYASAIAAFRAAMTGHGIWTSLHANDVVGILGRLKDMGVDMSLVTDPQIVTGMISQRLVPRVCPTCKQSFRAFRHLVDEAVAERVEKFCDVDNVWLVGSGSHDGQVCKTCGGRGTNGRVLIAETLVPTKGFMDEFLRNGQTDARRYWVRKMGGITRNQVLIRRINEGLVDPVRGETNICLLDEDQLILE